MSKKLKAKNDRKIIRLNPNDYDGLRNERNHYNSTIMCGDYSDLSDDDDYFQE